MCTNGICSFPGEVQIERKCKIFFVLLLQSYWTGEPLMHDIRAYLLIHDHFIGS